MEHFIICRVACSLVQQGQGGTETTKKHAYSLVKVPALLAGRPSDVTFGMKK